jgi:hypothetical protein
LTMETIGEKKQFRTTFQVRKKKYQEKEDRRKVHLLISLNSENFDCDSTLCLLNFIPKIKKKLIKGQKLVQSIHLIYWYILYILCSMFLLKERNQKITCEFMFQIQIKIK